eukprot:scaffold154_cov129-Cylindrotheca_fusiformis.AAC.39
MLCHRLTRYEDGNMGLVPLPFPNVGHGFLGDVRNNGQAPFSVEIPDAAFSRINANTQVPDYGMTPHEAYHAVYGAVQTVGREADCSPLLDWLRLTLTRPAANQPPRTAIPPLSPPVLATQKAISTFQDYRLNHMLHDLPGLAPGAILQLTLGEPLRKRQKGLADLFGSKNWKKEVEELDELLTPHIGADHSADPSHYVIPKMMRTWKEDEMREELCVLRDRIRPRLDNFDEEKAAKRGEKLVIGVRLGTGYGKTHGLVEAGKFLSAFPLIYITYNQGQILDQDEKNGRKALLIRLILAVGGAASASSGAFLMSKSAEGLFGDGYACEKAVKGDIVIGVVDEIRSLSVGAAKAVISELGKVAAGYKGKSKNMCTVLVTSLDWDPFMTNSDRSVKIWNPPVANDDTFWHFARGVKGYKHLRTTTLWLRANFHRRF